MHQKDTCNGSEVCADFRAVLCYHYITPVFNMLLMSELLYGAIARKCRQMQQCTASIMAHGQSRVRLLATMQLASFCVVYYHDFYHPLARY